ncbi:MAG TPA: hypothetical protein VJ252_00670 [Chthoniobacterales bacterium]|nr:hypothetical protein [Chthoniobacterales bacterium]
MKRLPFFSFVLLFSLCVVYGAEKQRLTIVDYFLLLPRDYFEGPPQNWLDFLRQPTFGVVDLANGYISCTGDGAQPEFEVALFRYRDGRPLLAVCHGELEGPDSVYLDFLELGSDGKMKRMRHSIFPVADAGNDKGDWRFQLPRQGKTILVINQRSGKILRKLTWNGEKFQDAK